MHRGSQVAPALLGHRAASYRDPLGRRGLDLKLTPTFPIRGKILDELAVEKPRRGSQLGGDSRRQGL